MPPSAEERQLISHSVHHICADLAQQYFSRPEQVCAVADFAAALRPFREQGVIELGPDPGYGLWEGGEDSASLTLSLDLLQLIARTHTALALSLHRTALARQILRASGADTPATLTTSLCLHGHQGLGRGELALWWQGSTVSLPLLNDVFAADAARLALVARSAGDSLCAVFEQGQLHWHLCAHAPQQPAQLGLDELACASILPAAGVRLPAVSDARALARSLWQREWLGLLAIELGCTQRAYALAQAYAELRVQGGQRISAHRAVSDMLLELRASIVEVGDFLAAARLDAASFYRLLLARNRLQTALQNAVNAAMQIFGGLGYMRDNGVEKCFRDLYQLRYQSGGPLDMQALAAQWQEAA